MKNYILKIFLVMLNIFSVFSAFGQIRMKGKTYNQKDLEKNKIYKNTYHLWQRKDGWGPMVKDTIPYFVDDRNYKGIINYGVEFKSKNFKAFNFFENKTMYFIKVAFEKCKYNSKDSIIEIEGFVSGGWGDKAKTGLNESKNYIDLFIGKKTDTITPCYYNFYVNKDQVDTKWNNEVINQNHILDTFPSFYFKKYSHFRTVPRGNRPFKIRSKVDVNTILAFGGSGCYSEIFDIGAMIYTPHKNRKNKVNKKDYKESEDILIKNRLVSDIEKEKVQKGITYYTYTEKAENYITIKHFAKANEQYKSLSKNYPILFARDIHNAIRCAILARDYKTAFFWGEKLAAKGIALNYFNAKVFNVLKRNLGWKNFSLMHDSIYKIAQSKWNVSLKLQMEQLANEDQVDYGLENRKEPKVLYETTERITDKLITLLKKEGYPSEEKVGAYTENDTILVSPRFNVLMIHALQQKTKSIAKLKEILDKNKEAYEYDADRIENSFNAENMCNHIYRGNLYISKACSANNPMTKKIIFSFKNPFGFIIQIDNVMVTHYDEENSEDSDKHYRENFNFVIKLSDDQKFYEE